MLQGVMKHIIKWISCPTVFGPVNIDTQCKCLPPNHSITPLTKGITTLSHVTGKEHKNICRILLGLIISLPLPGGQASSCVIKAVQALLDFLYLAQFPSHTTDTLRHLKDSLALFHHNKTVFVDLGTRGNFHIPKLHSLLHYESSIGLFGTTDNYNTEQTEHLHINFTKDAYHATNHKDEYMQMTTWLERREKVQQHAASMERQQQEQPRPRVDTGIPISPPQPRYGSLKMTQHPTIKSVSFDDLSRKYGAHRFQDALANFVVHKNYPGTLGLALQQQSDDTLIPFRAVPVFHRIKFTASNHYSKSEVVDSVHVQPEQLDLHGRIIPSRFDTVLVCTNGNKGNSVHITTLN